MSNYKLLEIHRKKLSIYFALFVLFSIWIIELFFLVSVFYSDNLKLEKKLKIKYDWVENILKNKDIYSQDIVNDNSATKLILEKSLAWVTIIENWKTILWNIDSSLLWDYEILNSKEFKYYRSTSIINLLEYEIIIKIKNDSSYYRLLLDYVYFILFTIPFILFFYYIWYLFVWKNLSPIKETISSLESFSWNINHEIKTPITEIISTLSLAQKVKWNYEQAINQSLNSTQKLNKILDSMLWIINLVWWRYKKEKVNLINELNLIIKENNKKIDWKKIKINKLYSKNNYYIEINKEHFNICIWNIFKNAIKYSHKNWSIEVKFNNWEIEIKDFWIWIEEKNLKNIFNRYFRENYISEEWYWLWLALVKKIVDLNKWNISIESKKNIWTNVKINFTNQKN